MGSCCSMSCAFFPDCLFSQYFKRAATAFSTWFLLRGEASGAMSEICTCPQTQIQAMQSATDYATETAAAKGSMALGRAPSLARLFAQPVSSALIRSAACNGAGKRFLSDFSATGSWQSSLGSSAASTNPVRRHAVSFLSWLVRMTIPDGFLTPLCRLLLLCFARDPLLCRVISRKRRFKW